LVKITSESYNFFTFEISKLILPEIERWLQKTHIFGQPRWGIKIGIFICLFSFFIIPPPQIVAHNYIFQHLDIYLKNYTIYCRKFQQLILHLEIFLIRQKYWQLFFYMVEFI
jgi:hypothetical protein